MSIKWAIEVHQVKSEDAIQVWRSYADLFDKFWVTQDYLAYATQGEVIEEVEEGKKQIWLVHGSGEVQALCITSVRETTTAKYCEIDILISYERIELDWNRMLQAHVEPWAKSIGCQFMLINGRRGWLRALADYHEVSCVARKEL